MIFTTGVWHHAETLSNRVNMHNGNRGTEKQAKDIVVSWCVIGDCAARCHCQFASGSAYGFVYYSFIDTLNGNVNSHAMLV